MDRKKKEKGTDKEEAVGEKPRAYAKEERRREKVKSERRWREEGVKRGSER